MVVSSIRLRGTSTVLGSADPLYIVDGVIVNNSSPILIDLGGGAQNRLVDLDPSMIDHVEIVKGAAAAALYGSLANNGVVQIFTKRGVPGPPRVTFTTSVNFDEVRKTLPVNMYPYNKRFDDTTKVPVQRYDWQNDIFRRAVGTTQHLDISGGSENTRYIVSASYLGNQGIIKGENYQRANVSVGLDQVLNERLSLSVNAAYSNSNAHQLPNGGLTSAWGVLTGFIFGPNTFSPLPDPTTGVYPHKGVLVNPIEAIDLYKFQQQVSRFIGSARLVANPWKGLSVDYTFGYDTYNQLALAYIPVGTSAPGLSQGFSRRAELDFLHLDNSLNLSYKTDILPILQSTRCWAVRSFTKGHRTLVVSLLSYPQFRRSCLQEQPSFLVNTEVNGPLTAFLDRKLLVFLTDYS
ncbi:MAG: TonB-dependent receptor plug domain-containing protein [Bacteroidota bacterium]